MKLFSKFFESSARNQDVLAANDGLQWDFLGAACSIKDEVFNGADFMSALAGVLEQASTGSDFAA